VSTEDVLRPVQLGEHLRDSRPVSVPTQRDLLAQSEEFRFLSNTIRTVITTKLTVDVTVAL
jgi:hypothetical protein